MPDEPVRNQQKQAKMLKDPLPVGLDPTDARAVRAWIRGAVEAEVQGRGHVVPTIRIVCVDKIVSAELDGMFEVGQETHAAAYWHALGSIEGAVRRLRIGTVLVPSDTGEGARTTVVIMEWEPDASLPLDDSGQLVPGLPGFGVRWWLTCRPFGQGGGGTGVLHGEWGEREGVNFDGLDDPFRELLDAQNVSVGLPPLAWETSPGPKMSTEWIMRKPGTPAPSTATGFARDIGMLTDHELLTKGMSSLWVFSFHGDWVEWWRVTGHLPCSVDDLLRNIAGFSGAEALGAVIAGAAQVPDGATKRALITVVEHRGRRAQRALVVDFGEDGRPRPLGVLHQDEVEVPAGEGWIGVSAGYDLQIKTDAVERIGGAEPAEG